MSAVEVADQELKSSIRQEGITLVDFSAPWCPPCKVLLPILDELDEQYGEHISILKINCDESPQSVAEFGIMSMPTVIVYHNGTPVEKLVGLRPKTVYQSLIEKYNSNE